jgi:hypothetical protein
MSLFPAACMVWLSLEIFLQPGAPGAKNSVKEVLKELNPAIFHAPDF